MAVTKIGIVYGPKGTPRYVVIPSTDDELDTHHIPRMHPKERMHKVLHWSIRKDDNGLPLHEDIRNAVALHLLRDPADIPSSRCATVRDGVVVDVIPADPDIDKHPVHGDAGLLIETETANLGDLYDAATGTFTRPPDPGP